MALLSVCLLGADDPHAARLYQQHCAMCHDTAGNPRIPTKAALSKMAPSTILRAITTGVMAHQGASLPETERVAVATWLSAALDVSARPIANPCSGSTVSTSQSHWDSWGGPQNLRYQPAGGIGSADVPRLRLKWAFGFPDASMMRSQPAVYGGRIFAGSQDGSVYSLDASSGCVHWSANIGSEVRSGMVVAEVTSKPVLFFGDASGRVHAIDAGSGREIWQMNADDHPATRITGTPVFWKGRLYVPVASSEEPMALQPGYLCCTFRGSLVALEAATGKVVWKGYTIDRKATTRLKTVRGTEMVGPSGAAIWSAPTIDPERSAVYVTTGDNYSDPTTPMSDAVVAFDLHSGKLLWHRQFTKGDAANVSCWQPDKKNCPDSDGPDFDFGASPILARVSPKQRVLFLAQKSGMIYAVDPDRRGKMLWEARVGEGGIAGGIQWGPASDGMNVYVALSDMGIRPPAERKPDSPRYEIDPNKGGGLFAYRLSDGQRIWHTPAPGCDSRRPCSPAQSAAVTAIPGVAFSGSVDGRLRAYSTDDGRISWTFDTARLFETVNGVTAKGGSMDVGGPVVADGMVYVNSGYLFLGGMPGNVLLAFSIDGR